MNFTMRLRAFRAHGLYLFLASIAGLRMDILGIFYGIGPESHIVAKAPHAGIGFLEAHGLAFFLSLWMMRTAPRREWHLTGAAIGLLLGICNLMFWQIFIEAQMLWGGYLFTSLHLIFAALQGVAALSATERELQGLARCS
jgi:hypothetical protein